MASAVLLLLPTSSYKTEAFVTAADRLGISLVVGTDRRQALEALAPGHTLALDFTRPEASVAEIRRLAAAGPLAAVLGVDDETTELAAFAARELGLPHNPVASVAVARDKFGMRTRLAEAGLPGPAFRRVAVDASRDELMRNVRFPCVVKPLSLSASRGVLRADDPVALAAARDRIAAILRRPDVARRPGDRAHLLIEDYLPGREVALEGLLVAGELRPLALLDKPDPLTGPTFEETLFVTPSRHPRREQQAAWDLAAAACRALGLREGPVHAEARLHRGRAWPLEVAPRTIGGLCSRVLRFGAGVSLEELVLRHATGGDLSGLAREEGAAGVMMLPIPAAGRLRGVAGLDAALAVPGVEDVVISLHAGARLEPLPEGNRYLGFAFARGETPARVETALREAHRRLRFEIESCGS